jgi:thioredoxin-dependent peroxiredoxin
MTRAVSAKLNAYANPMNAKRFSIFLLGMVMTMALGQSLSEGDAAFLPALEDSYGKTVNLADIPPAGHWLVLWFYPKAMTSGCSLQAKRYSDLSREFEAADIRTYGISHDNAEEQCEFIESMKLSGQMLPDTAGELATAYGVAGVFYNRDTVLINPEGNIEKIWRSVNPVDDADKVLEYVKSQ